MCHNQEEVGAEQDRRNKNEHSLRPEVCSSPSAHDRKEAK